MFYYGSPADPAYVPFFVIRETGTNEFRKLIERLQFLWYGFEALHDLPLEDVRVETPIETCRTPMISGKACCCSHFVQVWVY